MIANMRGSATSALLASSDSRRAVAVAPCEKPAGSRGIHLWLRGIATVRHRVVQQMLGSCTVPKSPSTGACVCKAASKTSRESSQRLYWSALDGRACSES
jgi:hypothetical protein